MSHGTSFTKSKNFKQNQKLKSWHRIQMGAKGLYRKQPTEMLNFKGTDITTTSPHSTQHNACVERRLCTTFDATRVAFNKSHLHQTLWPDAAMDAVDKMNYIPTKHITGSFLMLSMVCFVSDRQPDCFLHSDNRISSSKLVENENFRTVPNLPQG